MSNALTNGRRVGNKSPEAKKIMEIRQQCRENGMSYPYLAVDDFFDHNFFWWGPTAYRADDYTRLEPTKEARGRKLVLPDHWILDGEARLPGETRVQYATYLAYRDLGPERNFSKLAAIMASSSKRNYTPMSVRFYWQERATAYDTHMEVEARRHAQALMQDQLQEEVARRHTYLTNEWEVIEKGFEVVKEMLRYPVVEQESVRVEEDGKKIITIWRPGRWTMATVASLIDVLTKSGRLHTGLSTSNAAIKSDPMAQERMRQGQEQPMNGDDQAMHVYASQQAEERYFEACEEWKQRRANQPGIVGAPALTARVVEQEVAV